MLIIGNDKYSNKSKDIKKTSRNENSNKCEKFGCLSPMLKKVSGFQLDSSKMGLETSYACAMNAAVAFHQ